jgi:DNA invertase Pin-like site-specific DNA recombinase
MENNFGYARVSTNEQNADLQVDALMAAGCNRVFEDHISGTKASRPELDRMLDQLRPGDVLVVWRLDRLGRSMRHLVALIEELSDRGVGFRSVTEAIDTTTTGGKLVFHIFAALAEFERNLIVERTQAGLAAARARGRVGGRPPALTPAQIRTAQALYSGRQHTVAEIASTLNVSSATIYRSLDRTAA